MIMGAILTDCMLRAAALLLLLAVPEVEELVPVATTPEPCVAVPVEVPSAFWEPFPVRPAPVPAPVLNN